MTQVEGTRLEVNSVIPNFNLPSLDGHRVSPRDFKQRANLVIAYLDLNRCGRCTEYLAELADNHNAFRDLETTVLIVVPSSVEEVQARLGGVQLPFAVLVDEHGEFAKSFLGVDRDQAPVGAVFVTDRYGELRAQMLAGSEADLTEQSEIIAWLDLIEMECPECGPGG